MSKKDLASTMDEAVLKAVKQYETYVELARFNDIPGVLTQPDHFDDGEIAPLGLTFIHS